MKWHSVFSEALLSTQGTRKKVFFLKQIIPIWFYFKNSGLINM